MGGTIERVLLKILLVHLCSAIVHVTLRINDLIRNQNSKQIIQTVENHKKAQSLKIAVFNFHCLNRVSEGFNLCSLIKAQKNIYMQTRSLR